MCGPDTSNRPRGGALAVLSPSVPDARQLRGDLAFHNPGDPNSVTATHARWTGSEGCCAEVLEGLVVVIHRSGDMTRRSEDCGLFRQFALAKASAVTAAADDDGLAPPYYELALPQPVSLAVGDDGIIGRRVSIFSKPPSSSGTAVAEGVVGFNFMQPATASL